MRMNKATLEHIEKITGHHFNDPDILTQALTHSSASSDNNERLEFVGDRVLGLITAHLLYSNFADEPEGDLAKRHTEIVREKALAAIADKIDLGKHLIMSAAEKSSGGQKKSAIIADAVEALIAALYLDGGIEAAGEFIEKYWIETIRTTAKPPQEAKTALQEWAQGKALPLPTYDIVEQSGPDHEPVFTVQVTVETVGSAKGQAASKRKAEKLAAKDLLAYIESKHS